MEAIDSACDRSTSVPYECFGSAKILFVTTLSFRVSWTGGEQEVRGTRMETLTAVLIHFSVFRVQLSGKVCAQ